MKRPLLAKIIWWGFRLIFIVLGRWRIEGTELFPREGGVLLVTNHLSYVDPPFIFVTTPRSEDIIPLVADSYKSSPFYSFLVRGVQGVWINRGAGDRAAVKASLAILKSNKILGMAPEGTRSKTGFLQQGKSGAAYLASVSGTQVVPVGLIGTETAFKELMRLHRPEIIVRYGRPFTLPSLTGDNKSAQLDQHTHEIMCRIAALLPEKYHGVYKGEARIKEIIEEEKSKSAN